MEMTDNNRNSSKTMAEDNYSAHKETPGPPPKRWEKKVTRALESSFFGFYLP